MARTKRERRIFGCSICWLVAGVVLFIIDLLILLLLPQIINIFVHEFKPLSRDGFSTGRWLKPPYDSLLQIWFFNLTNPEAFFGGREKARVNEMGPYAFKEVLTKEAYWLLDHQIEYSSRNYWYPVPHPERGLDWLNDKITLPNVPLLTLYNQLAWKNMPWYLETLLDEVITVLEKSELHVMRTVRQLMFDGYDDPLISFQHKLNPTAPTKMGFYFGRNGSLGIRYVIDDGTDDYRKTGTVRSWNNLEHLNFWVNGTSANDIRGKDEVFSPGVSKSDVLRIFVGALCRSLYLTYHDVDVVVKGLAGYRFNVPETVFDASREENFGFCQHTTDRYYANMPHYEYDGVNQTCLPSGLLNVSTCQSGAPIVLSLPHFKFADVQVQESVDGMTPGSEHDLTIVDLEPASHVIAGTPTFSFTGVEFFAKIA